MSRHDSTLRTKKQKNVVDLVNYNFEFSNDNRYVYMAETRLHY